MSGLTVMVALAGLLFTGLAVFTAMALATIVVVAIAVVGSVTVLPAVLAKLGDRVDTRPPAVRGPHPRTPLGPARWGRLAGAVTRHPARALIVAVCVLGALAVPAIDMHPADPGTAALPARDPDPRRRAPDRPRVPRRAERARHRRHRPATWTASRTPAVPRPRRPRSPAAAGRSTVAPGATAAAVVTVPMPDRGIDARSDRRRPARRPAGRRRRIGPGHAALVTGDAAGSLDFSNRLRTATPLVIAFVLGLTLVLLFAAFRSLALAATVVALNLVSVGATYGVLVASSSATGPRACCTSRARAR